MASDDEKQEGKGFTVQDRRRFSPDTGEAREAREESSAQPTPSAETSQATQDSSTTEGSHTAQETLPEINFSTFVISLSTQALMHLGEMASPLSGKVEPDVPVAKQMIDILAMLQDKTRGNLSANEDQLMKEVLFDLRMKYVEAVKKK